MRTLRHFFEAILHIIAQIIKAELIIRSVSDISGVSDFALIAIRLVIIDAFRRHTEEAVDLAHPFGVTFCQIVIDGDDMNAFAIKGVQIGGERRDECFTFARPHFSNFAAVQGNAANQLNVAHR